VRTYINAGHTTYDKVASYFHILKMTTILKTNYNKSMTIIYVLIISKNRIYVVATLTRSFIWFSINYVWYGKRINSRGSLSHRPLKLDLKTKEHNYMNFWWRVLPLLIFVFLWFSCFKIRQKYGFQNSVVDVCILIPYSLGLCINLSN